MAGKKKWRIAIGLAAALAALALWLWMPQPLSVEPESAGAGSRELLYEVGNPSFSPLVVGTCCLRVEGCRDGESVLLEKIFAVS